MKALLPLHKVRFVGMYHQQLSYCVTQFVEKDPKLAEKVLNAILMFWPRTFSAKEVLFLNEVRCARLMRALSPLYEAAVLDTPAPPARTPMSAYALDYTAPEPGARYIQ